MKIIERDPAVKAEERRKKALLEVVTRELIKVAKRDRDDQPEKIVLTREEHDLVKADTQCQTVSKVGPKNEEKYRWEYTGGIDHYYYLNYEVETNWKPEP